MPARRARGRPAAGHQNRKCEDCRPVPVSASLLRPQDSHTGIRSYIAGVCDVIPDIDSVDVFDVIDRELYDCIPSIANVCNN